MGEKAELVHWNPLKKNHMASMCFALSLFLCQLLSAPKVTFCGSVNYIYSAEGLGLKICPNRVSDSISEFLGQFRTLVLRRHPERV